MPPTREKLKPTIKFEPGNHHEREPSFQFFQNEMSIKMGRHTDIAAFRCVSMIFCQTYKRVMPNAKDDHRQYGQDI
jgi:hypothetical protein